MEAAVFKAKILIADDEDAVRDFLGELLEKDYEVLKASEGQQAVDLVKREHVDVVLMDVGMEPMDGIQALRLIKEMDEDVQVVMLTASQSVTTAVTAMKLGAFDYVTKPYEPDELKLTLSRAFEKRNLLKENIFYRSQLEGENVKFKQMVGRSRGMQDIFRVIQDVAKSSATVLITGESGTGKELVARAIHELSDRSEKLFVAVNCAAIPESLLESTLFGHEKGAFTSADQRAIGKFEFADSGTIFLDEIGSMPLALQGKLLRVLQERVIERIGGNKTIPIDIRVISATNVDLGGAVDQDHFRKDLYYRLNVVPIHLPTLGERKEDIPLLVDYFLERYNREFGKNVQGFTPEAMSLLTAYSWPGNIRELENFIERLMVLGRKEVIDVEEIPHPISSPPAMVEGQNGKEAKPDGKKETLVGDLERMQAEFIQKALLKTQGNKRKAAELLGMHRNTLRKKLSELARRGLIAE